MTTDPSLTMVATAVHEADCYDDLDDCLEAGAHDKAAKKVLAALVEAGWRAPEHPRVWTEPVEPGVGTVVRDRDGDEWTRTPAGWTLRREASLPAPTTTTWTFLTDYMPLTEVLDG